MGKVDCISSSTSSPISFSFSGCGFLGLYHVGVAACLREYAPINPATKYLGASAGSLIAMSLVCDLPLGQSTSETMAMAVKARSRALGPFHPSFDINKILFEFMMKTLPDDAHLKANGRLFISLTRVSDGKNVIINKFKSKEELIKAAQCSCFIPLWSGLVPPKFNGIAYIDGGFSDNLPTLDENTVTISPFAGESDICPQDDSYGSFQFSVGNTSILFTPHNLYRATRILFPAHPEDLSKMCQQGFDDALKYLQRSNKISCTRCLAIHFTLEKEETEDSNKGIMMKHKHHKHGKHENCRDCEYRRRIALLDSLPDSVVQAIQEACDQVNKGVINWIFRHRPMKLLAILTIPYLLPIDVTIVLFCKIYEKLPDIQQELKASFMRLVSFLQSLLTKIESKKHSRSAKFSCQLSMKEFDYTSEEQKIRKSSSSNPLRKSFSNDAKFIEKDFDFTNKQLEKLGRKVSYAGWEMNKNPRSTYRRKSMIEIGNKTVLPPERVISELNFDFKLDVKSPEETQTEPDAAFINRVKRSDSIDSKVLDLDLTDIDQSNAIEIANKALDWEKEFLEKCHDRLSDSDANLDKMFEITRKNDAVMAYYYTDENNKVKFTELFNIKDEDLQKMGYVDGEQCTGDGDVCIDPTGPNHHHKQHDDFDNMKKHTIYKKDNDDGLLETQQIVQQQHEDSTPIKRHRNSFVLID